MDRNNDYSDQLTLSVCIWTCGYCIKKLLVAISTLLQLDTMVLMIDKCKATQMIIRIAAASPFACVKWPWYKSDNALWDVLLSPLRFKYAPTLFLTEAASSSIEQMSWAGGQTQSFQNKTPCANSWSYITSLHQRYDITDGTRPEEAQKSRINDQINKIWASQQHMVGKTLRFWNALSGLWSRVEDGTKPWCSRNAMQLCLLESRHFQKSFMLILFGSLFFQCALGEQWCYPTDV